MKKLFFTGFFLISFVFPILAQVDHDYNPNDVVPSTGQSLTTDQIPVAILNAAKKDFDISNPETWTKFPYALKEYGWVYDKGASSVKPDRYEVTMKTNNGDDLSAVYSKDGILIATREVNYNAPIPASVLESLSNSIYSDWKVIGGKETIRYYYDKNSVEQHFRVTVQKDNVTRSISFNYQNSSPINKTASK